MRKTIIFAGLILMITLVSGCVQQQIPQEQPTQPTTPTGKSESTTTIEFTFANEAKVDTTITAFIEGEQVYEKKLISYATAGGYFGQEFEYKVLEVPNREFTLKVTERATGLEETAQINPADGKFISITLWTDKFIIQQTKDKQVRID